MSAEPFSFSKASEERFQEILGRYPAEHRKAALIPVLYVAQEQAGYLTVEVMRYVAGRLELPPAAVLNTATFYTLLRKEPQGRFHLQICTNVACFLRGSDDLVEVVRQRCGIGPGEVTADRLFSCQEVECLAACGTAPAVQVNWDYHEDLTPDAFGALIDRLRASAAGAEAPATAPEAAS